jgi:hypothetical protein
MTEATPNVPNSQTTKEVDSVKIATPDLKVFSDELIPIEIMTDLIFEDIGGTELINISRNDLINGQNTLYQPIKNISSIFFQYNPNNILGLQDTSDTIFKNFPIKFSNKVPNFGTGPNGEIVYIEEATGNLIINLVNMEKNEQVDVEILTTGTVFNGTIYEVNE